MTTPYDTVKALWEKADTYFAKAHHEDRSLNQYKGFIYQGKAGLLESTILNEEGNHALAKRTWNQAIESFELAWDRASNLGENYRAQAEGLLKKMGVKPPARDPASRGASRSARDRISKRRYMYFAEDLEKGYRTDLLPTMKAAKELAKRLSMANGHVVAVVAVDNGAGHFPKGSLHPQGAYYGRSWREGAYTYTPRTQ